jgi:hypothetical protein
MSDLLPDLRFALRRWTKRRTFALTAILTLALGIGAATAIFSVVNGVLLRPLPWKAADRLVAVWVARPQWRNQAALAAYWNRGVLSWPMFQGLQEKRRTLETVGTYAESQLVLGGAQNELVTSLKVSASFLPMLGTQPSLGRFFSAEEDTVASDAVLVTHEAWVRRFGASTDILGTRVMLNSSPRAIVGVLPPGFRVRQIVTDDYFEVMRIPVLKGQSLGSSSVSGAPVAVVSAIVSPTAPHTFIVVTAVLAAAAGVGTWAPVHRAGRVDPAVALRQG